MDLSKALPTFSKLRFSIVQLLVVTTVLAFSLAVLFNENEWLRATYGTLLLGVVLHEWVTAICARGERQYFALGFVCCLPIYYMSAFIYTEMLPYMITEKSYEILAALGVDLPSEEHYIGVMSSFWVLLASYTLGRLGQYWFRRRQLESHETAANDFVKASRVNA